MQNSLPPYFRDVCCLMTPSFMLYNSCVPSLSEVKYRTPLSFTRFLILIGSGSEMHLISDFKSLSVRKMPEPDSDTVLNAISSPRKQTSAAWRLSGIARRRSILPSSALTRTMAEPPFIGYSTAAMVRPSGETAVLCVSGCGFCRCGCRNCG